MVIKNPFEYGRELTQSELVDRAEELRVIRAAIRNRGKLFLIGPRRFGKTSLLSAADEAARAKGIVVIRVDAEKYESLELLAAGLLSSAATQLKGPLERTASRLREAASRLRPEIVAEEGSVGVRLGVSSNAAPLPLLTDALDAIEQLAAKAKVEVVVIIDEVQQIVVEHGLAAEKQLRATVQRHRHVGYIFCGSSTRLLSEMTGDADRPFYRLGERLFLERIAREDFLEFLHNAFEVSGMRVSMSAAERILDLAEDVPYNVQRLAHEVWETTRTATGRRVTNETIDAALERIVRRDDSAYTQTWKNLTANQKKALKAVIASKGIQTLSGELAQTLRIAVSSLSTALKSLESAHVIRLDLQLGGSTYRLVDPFFTVWLRLAQGSAARDLRI